MGGVDPIRRRGTLADAACCVALLGLALALSIPAWSAPVAWDPDGIAYQAKTLQYSGVPAQEALSQAWLLRSQVTPKNGRATLNSKVDFATWEMREIARRIAIPAAASRLLPVFGSRSLLALSIAAYVLLGGALYVLLRFRFARVYALSVTSLALCFPPLRRWSFAPHTDSAGLLLIVIALIAAALTLRRNRRWLLLWVPVVALGSITRESIAVAVAAVGVLAIRRVPRAIGLLLTGIAAIAPAATISQVSMRSVFAEAAAHRLHVPYDTSAVALLKHWALLAVGEPLYYLVSQPLWTAVLVVTVGAALITKEADLQARAARAAAIGAILFLATFPFSSGLRVELVLVPAAAFGAGLIAEDLVATIRMWAPVRRPSAETLG
jgi:hypothetical protein